jgi:hypothetical protein
VKLPFSTLVLVGILTAGIVMTSVKAQLGADRPPGVPTENWIAISDSVGILVASLPPPPTFYRFDPNQPGTPIPAPLPPNAIPLGIGSVRGVLMARQNGIWNRIVIELPPAQALPLEH